MFVSTDWIAAGAGKALQVVYADAVKPEPFLPVLVSIGRKQV